MNGNNGNKVSQSEVPAPAVPSVDVKIYFPKDPNKDHGKLRAFASATLGGVFAVNNIRIYDTEKGPFAAMPSTKGQDGKYHDICCPTTREMRQALNDAVLGAYQQAKEVERPSVRGAIKEAAKGAASHPTPDKQVKRTADKGAR